MPLLLLLPPPPFLLVHYLLLPDGRKPKAEAEPLALNALSEAGYKHSGSGGGGPCLYWKRRPSSVRGSQRERFTEPILALGDKLELVTRLVFTKISAITLFD